MAEKTEQNVTESYDSRVVSIRRTAKVVAGGRKFKFSAMSVIGDGNGRIGFGCGKAGEVVIAVQKANDQAKRNMIKIELRGETLQHPIQSHYGATTVIMKPAAHGTGIIAGGALRLVFEVLGVKNVIAKCIGSTNPINVVKAAIRSLREMSSPETIAEKRGKTVKEILGRKDDE